MSDGKINDQLREVGGYEPQGSTEIVAPGALRSVAAKRKRRKRSATELLPPAAADCAMVYVGCRSKDGKRG
jgi:hypothetical protein